MISLGVAQVEIELAVSIWWVRRGWVLVEEFVLRKVGWLNCFEIGWETEGCWCFSAASGGVSRI